MNGKTILSNFSWYLPLCTPINMQQIKISCHFSIKIPWELYYLQKSEFLKDLEAQSNRTFFNAGGDWYFLSHIHHGEVSAKKSIWLWHTTKNTFYSPPVQWIIRMKKHDVAVITLNYEDGGLSQRYVEIVVFFQIFNWWCYQSILYFQSRFQTYY